MKTVRLLAGCAVVAASLLFAAPPLLPAASPVEELIAKMTPEGRSKLPDNLRPEGHELATVFLKPLAKKASSTDKDKSRAQADELLRNRVSLLGGYPVQDLGDPYDWFRAPKGDLQWPTHLSRHQYLLPLARMYAASGEQKYAAQVVHVLLDWVKSFPLGRPGLDWGWKVRPGTGKPPSGEGRFQNYSDGPWTSLSAHARIDTWLQLLPMIATADCMDNRTTAILLNALLSTHRTLLLDYPRMGTANQFLSVGASLINLGLALPDFAGAEECRAIGLERVAQYAKTQIYEDGSVAECSPNYGLGSVGKLNALALDLKQRGIDMPPVVFERIRKAARYYALILDPSGRSPRIAKGGGNVIPALRTLNETIGDPEVEWILSRGEAGVKPAGMDSGFNWAGHFAMRSGWAPGDVWLFFEPGPRGSGHHDRAQLGIQLMAGGKTLLADPGYYSYSDSGDEGRMSRYLASTFAHNTAVVDGEGQISGPRGPNTAAGDYKWSSRGDFTVAEGSYTLGYGDSGKIRVVHNRRVAFLRQKREFTIEDSFAGAGSHTYDILWQAPPDAKVEVSGNRVIIRNGQAGAMLDFQCSAPLAVTALSGQREPLSGWYSEHYGELAPATTIRVSAKGSAMAVKTVLRIDME